MGLSHREIAQSCNVSKTTVNQALKWAAGMRDQTNGPAAKMTSYKILDTFIIEYVIVKKTR